MLLLDEPTQGMSHGDTQDTAELIKSLTSDVTVLLIEHDIGLVMSLSDHVDRHASGPEARRRRARRTCAATRPFRPPISGTPDMLDIRNLHTNYGSSHIIQGIDISVRDGEVFGMFGRNGVGKIDVAEGHRRLDQADARSKSNSPASASTASDPIASPGSASALCRRTGGSFPASRSKKI